jgi:hypothetical protein
MEHAASGNGGQRRLPVRTISATERATFSTARTAFAIPDAAFSSPMKGCPPAKMADVATYEGTDANKTARYMLRWVTRAGDKGPWSETVSGHHWGLTAIGG